MNKHSVGDGQTWLLPWQAPVSSMWVYRTTPARVEVGQLQPWHPHLWFNNVRSDLATPPSARWARPARELPSLSGHTVHALDPRGLTRYVAVSEPLDVEGEIVVRLLSGPDYARACYGSSDIRIFVLPLHRLWAY